MFFRILFGVIPCEFSECEKNEKRETNTIRFEMLCNA